MVIAFAPFAVGTLLLSGYSRRFAFHEVELIQKIFLGLLILLTPLALYQIRRIPSAMERLARHSPAAWKRDWILLPLMAATLVGMVLAGPLGWLVAVSAWSDQPIQQVQATAIQVDAYRNGRRFSSCHRPATLRFASLDKKTCLDDLYASSLMQAGQRLDVGIVPFHFGFLIVSLVQAAPAQTQKN